MTQGKEMEAHHGAQEVVICERVRKIVEETLSQSVYGWNVDVAGDCCLRVDLKCDDIDAMTIAMALEDSFLIDIADAEISAWQVVSDIEKTVLEKASW